MSAASYTIINTTKTNQEESKLTESVARGLADGYAFNFLETMSPNLRATDQKVTVFLPQIKGDDL